MTIGRLIERIHLLTSSWHLLQGRKQTVARFTTFQGLESLTVQFDIDLLLTMIGIAGILKSRSANLHINRPNHSSFLPNLGLAPCRGELIIDLLNRIRVILLNKLLNT
jgi:hypothetical protein